MTETTATLWWERATTTYDLRTDGRVPVLISRHADEHGLDHDGSPAPWHDVATVRDWTEARAILRRLQPPVELRLSLRLPCPVCGTAGGTWADQRSLDDHLRVSHPAEQT